MGESTKGLTTEFATAATRWNAPMTAFSLEWRGALQGGRSLTNEMGYALRPDSSRPKAGLRRLLHPPDPRGPAPSRRMVMGTRGRTFMGTRWALAPLGCSRRRRPSSMDPSMLKVTASRLPRREECWLKLSGQCLRWRPPCCEYRVESPPCSPSFWPIASASSSEVIGPFRTTGRQRKGHVRRAGDGHSDAETHGDISGIALLARLTKVAEGHSDRTTA